MPRYAVVHLPVFAIDRAVRDGRLPAKAPGATVDSAHGARRLAAVGPAAAGLGAGPGQPLADARALCPDLAVTDAAPEADRRALADLAAWAERFSPIVAPAATGDGLHLDITGCAHLFGGEPALHAALEDRLVALGLTARAAVADTLGAAHAVAAFPGEDSRIVPPDSQRDALAPRPVAALRLPAATVEGLHRVGLRRIGDLYDTPRAPLARRFGEAVPEHLDRALGHTAEVVPPHRPAPPCRVQRAFAEPIGKTADVEAALHDLLDTLTDRLSADGRGARRVELAAYRVDGTAQRLQVGTSRATRDPAHLFRLFRDHLETLDAGFGIETVHLAAATDPLGHHQPGLDGRDDGATEAVSQLVDRLAARLGSNRVFRLAPADSHVPERAMRRLAPLAPATDTAWPDLERPPRLLRRPEPVDATAPLPDRPPVMFRWRNEVIRLRDARGPERLLPEWWRPASADAPWLDAPRDYYRVEATDGRRFWLFREHATTTGTGRRRWYLHGMLP